MGIVGVMGKAAKVGLRVLMAGLKGVRQPLSRVDFSRVGVRPG